MPAHLPFDALNAALKAAGEDDAPAHAGAAGRGRADGLRPHRHPAPVAAAHLAPSQAAGRGRPGRALPRGRLGLLPAGRAAAAAPSWRARWSARLDPADPIVARDRERLAAVRARARRGGAGLFPRARRASGTASASCTSPTRRWRRAIRDALADRPFRSLLDLGTGTGRMLELFGADDRARARHRPVARHAAAGARAARARGPAPLQRAAGRHLRPAGAGATRFDVVIIHQVLHFLDDGAPRDPRGGARAARRAGGCWWSTSRRTIWNSCASEHAHRRLGFAAGDGGAMDERRRASTSRCTSSLRAGARLRRQDRGVALARRAIRASLMATPTEVA